MMHKPAIRFVPRVLVFGKHATRDCLTTAFCVLMLGVTGWQSRAAQQSQAARDELAGIDGTWQLVYAETDGKSAPAEQVQPVRVVLKGRSHTVYIGDKQVVHGENFTIDSTATPKTVDDTLSEGPNKGKQIHGIYELGGDTLATCVAGLDQERPRRFATTPGSGHTFRVFKRVRPEETPKDKAVRDELIKFGGTWRFAELEIGGMKVPAENFAANRLVLQGDRFLATDAQETATGYYKIDPTTVPKTIDVIFTSGTPKGTTVRGIYELTGDTYKTCISGDDQPRPAKFESQPGSKDALEVLKREKP